MRVRIGPVLLFVVGAVVAQLGVFGGYLDYVKPAQGPLLIAAGLLLAVVGVVGMFVDDHPDGHADPSDRVLRLHTHGPLAAAPEVIEQARRERREARRNDHRVTPAIAVLLVVPLVVALGVSPPPLGAFTAARSGAAVPSRWPAATTRRCRRATRSRWRCMTTPSGPRGTADARSPTAR